MERQAEGVYFLFNGEQLVYIGKSDNIFRRIGDHINSEKKFDSWEYYICDVYIYKHYRINNLEKSLIEHFNPFYNKNGTVTDKSLELINKKAYMAEIYHVIEDFEHKNDIKTSIIRCRECKFFCDDNCPMRLNVNEFDFCSKAKKGKNAFSDIEKYQRKMIKALNSSIRSENG